MSIPHAPVLTQVLNEATDIARATDQALTSGHVLLAFFTVHNAAERLLKDRGVDEDKLLDIVSGKMSEPPDTLADVISRAEQIAAGCGAPNTDCLHVLYAITRAKASAGFVLLKGTGEPVAALRQRALGILTGAMPVWVADEEVVRRDSRTAASHVRRSNKRSRRSVRSELPRAGMSKELQWSPPKIDRTRPPLPVAVSTFDPRPRSRVGRTVQPPVVESRVAPPPSVLKVSEDDPAEPWLLDPDRYPWLTSLGRNLSAEAAREGLDDLVGRERELDQIIDIIGKRRANNPCLLGEPGVGKTAVVEALAKRLVEDPPSNALAAKIIVELDVGSLLIGTHLRGSFSEKLQGIREEVKDSGRVIIFFDELHTLVGAGSTGDGAQDAANELKAGLARGEFPCIGATTMDEWKKHVEPDPALTRRFYPVMITEPCAEQAAAMITHVIDAYAEHHQTAYEPDAVMAACLLSQRFIVDRHLPDKAIALLDLAGSRASRAGRRKVTREDVGALVAEQAEIPIERVLSSDRARLLELEGQLAEYIVGHADKLARIAEVIRRNAAGFGSQRPQGSFLFLGPTGVGKTETAKILAKLLHGSEEALLRFDLSEFSESHAVARLVGAPPGYIGHDAGGQLTEAMRRRPARVLLLDEIEKAHRDVLQVFLQILDDGRLTDSHGRTVSFSESIIVMTSNLGADLSRIARPIGFGDRTAPDAEADETSTAILESARASLAPELWGRIEERLVFAPLSVDEVREVTRRLAASSSKRLTKERGIEYVLDDTAVDFLVAQGGYDARLGARPMRQVLSRIVEGPIAARILEGRLHADETVLVSTTERGTLAFLVGEDRTSLSQRPVR